VTAALLKPGALEGRAVAATGRTVVLAAPRADAGEHARAAAAGGESFSGCRFALR